MSEESKMITVSEDELAKVENNILNAAQLNVLLQGTPKDHIYERKAKGGGKWKYVTGTYVKKVLNLLFGWLWSFEVVKFEYNMQYKQCIVLGKLTVESGGKTIVKNQFGRADIKFKNVWDKELGKKVPTDEPLDLGNDLKAATTDSLKKCASELGIAADVYAPNEFKAIRVTESTPEQVQKERMEDNIINHIKNATTKAQLRQCVGDIVDDSDIMELYNEKFDSLKK